MDMKIWTNKTWLHPFNLKILKFLTTIISVKIKCYILLLLCFILYILIVTLVDLKKFDGNLFENIDIYNNTVH